MRVDSEQVSVRRLRRGAWMGRLAMFVLWLAGAVIFAGPWELDRSVVGCWTPILVLAGTSILLALRHGMPFAAASRRGKRGSVTVEGDRIDVEIRGRRRSFSRAAIASGWTEPEAWLGAETVVLLTRDGTEIRVACARHAAVEGLLRAAGVAPDQRAVKIRVRPHASLAQRAWAIFVTFIAAALSLVCLFVALTALFSFARTGLSTVIAVSVFGAFSLGFGALVRRFAPALFTTTISIGTDGVVVERLRGDRLFRRAEITDVHAASDALILELASGAPVRIPAAHDAAVVVANRIEESLRIPPAPLPTLARLDRGGRSVAAWLADLRGLSHGSRGYREAALARQDLLDTVKDGAAPAERRLAAAVALSTQKDEEARAALRIAADTCADPRLRVVLDRAGEMPDEEIEEALARVALAR